MKLVEDIRNERDQLVLGSSSAVSTPATEVVNDTINEEENVVDMDVVEGETIQSSEVSVQV